MTALAAIAAAAAPHEHGHSCTDGRWWNSNAGTRQHCPTWLHLDTARTGVEHLLSRTHDAAHDGEAMEAVATAMLAGTPLTDLDPEQRAGWIHLARLATEALALHLDPAPVVESVPCLTCGAGVNQPCDAGMHS